VVGAYTKSFLEFDCISWLMPGSVLKYSEGLTG